MTLLYLQNHLDFIEPSTTGFFISFFFCKSEPYYQISLSETEKNISGQPNPRPDHFQHIWIQRPQNRVVDFSTKFVCGCIYKNLFDRVRFFHYTFDNDIICTSVFLFFILHYYSLLSHYIYSSINFSVLIHLRMILFMQISIAFNRYIKRLLLRLIIRGIYEMS